MPPKSARHSRGFTMVETMLSVALFAAIAGVSTAVLMRNSDQPGSTRDIGTIINAVRRAEQSSIQSEQDSAWGVYISDATVTIFRGASFDERAAEADTSIPLETLEAENPVELTFPKTSGAPNVPTTISLNSSNGQYTIYVSTDGLITY